MDEEHKRKTLERNQKLEEKNKNSVNKSDGEQTPTFSVSSLSLSPLLLPANVEMQEATRENENPLQDSEPTSISEDIEVSSTENDRSLQEIVIANIPISSPEPSINSIMFKTSNINDKSVNNSLISETSFISLHALEMFENMNNEQVVLDEIIKYDDSIKSSAGDNLSSATLKDDTLHELHLKLDEVDNKVDDANILVSTEIESLRELNSSNHSTTSLGTSTDYKIYQDKSLMGSVEYQDIVAHKDDHIKQLTVALEHILEDRNRLKSQADHFVQEIDVLKEQLVQTTAIIKKRNWNQSPTDSENEEKQKSGKDKMDIQEKQKDIVPEDVANDSMQIIDKLDSKNENLSTATQAENTKSLSEKDTLSKLIRLSDVNFDSESIQFNDTLSPEELDIIQDIRCKINLYIEQKMQEFKKVHSLELKILEDQIKGEKAEHLLEVAKLRELLTSVKAGSVEIDELRKQLNEKHSKEMEELRTYFEERCAEIEKHYSEEIFSQQSRKMSAGSSICSEIESEVFPAAQCGPGGDATPENIKSDMNNLRLELQNKYHAELEILREDYENRIDELRINNENLQQENEKKYLEQIEALKSELEEAQKYVLSQQEVASSGDFEIAEVVQSYQRRLQEQVMLAKMDIISALESQIQNLITNAYEDAEWPSELLQLREIIIKEVKEQHVIEINKVKEDYEKKLSRMTEREKRNSIHSGDEAEIKKERDNLKKVTSYLRNLLAELMKYFTKCEDELNNTLVEELLKQGIDKDLNKLDLDMNDSYQSSISDKLESSVASTKVKRVHFTPDVSGIITLLDDTTKENLDTTKDISFVFQNELQLCLERLKSEANAILTATANLKEKTPELPIEDTNKCIEDKLSSLTRQLITQKQEKNNLSLQLDNAKEYIQNIEVDKLSLEGQLEKITTKQHHLISELEKAKEKIINLVESGRKEIISEGYGENHITGSTTFAERLASMVNLQERARNMLTEGTSNSPLLNLVEELCDEGDRIVADAKKDHVDLIQQIEAADKKLRAATKFMEDQAIDRENERDDAQKEMAALKEQLRVGERNKSTCERINNEERKLRNASCTCNINYSVMQTVERLENQMREMSVLMSESEKKKTEVETELKEAIDKIWVLRDIIRDLESQIELQVKEETNLKNIVSQLQDKVKEQVKYNDEVISELNSLRNKKSDDQLNEHIIKLEQELGRLRLSSELAGPVGTTKQVKTQLFEIEKILDKRTKDLELLHTSISTTACSSPSEDMSIRDQVRGSHSSSGSYNDTELPLEQLARLKDKLVRHSRAEDAAMKRIRDLEMQLFSSKQEYEEMQGEKDVLQEQLSEQMHMISSLQLRLDEQRLRVESVQKETNTALEHKVYELENEVQYLKEELHIRDKTIKQLTVVVEQTKKLLTDQQKQLNTSSDIDKELIDQLHKETETLRTENMLLKNRLQSENKLNQSIATPDIPELLDSMLSEKNADIDRLRSQLDDIKKELHYFKSLNISKDQLLHLDNSKTITSMLSPSGDEPDQYRREEQFYDSIQDHRLLEAYSEKNKTVFTGSSFRDPKYPGKQHSPFLVSEVSTIEKIDPKQLNLSEELELKRESFSLPTDNRYYKKVHFQDAQIELEEKIKQLQTELNNKNSTIKNFEETVLSEYVVDIRDLRKKLEYSESSLKETKDILSEEIERLKAEENRLQTELTETKDLVQKKIHKILDLDAEGERKDKVCYNIAKEKCELQDKLKELETKIATFNNFEQQIIENNKEIAHLKEQLNQMNNNDEVENLRTTNKKLEDEISNLRKKNFDLENILKNKDTELSNLEENINKHESEITTKNDLLSKYSKDCNNMASQFELFMSQVKTLEETIANNDTLIRDLEENLKVKQTDIHNYEQKIFELQNILSDYQYKMDSINKDSIQLNKKEIDFIEARYKTELAEKDLKLTKHDTTIESLKKEIHHLQDFLYQKDKIITQMTRDSTSLHQSLEAIQSKIQESGNVIDLKKRLRDEQSLTTALHEELQFLKHHINEYEASDETSIRKELKDNLEKEHALNTELLNIRESLMQDLHIMEQKYEVEKDSINRLQLLLDEEKHKSNAIQLQDANIIQKMRERLEQVVDSENDLRHQLESEKQAKHDIQQKTGAVSLDSSKMNDTHFELACIRMDLVKATTENDILKSEFTTMNNLNALMKGELEQMKHLTEVQKSEIDELKEKIFNLRDSEQSEKDKIKRNRQELANKDIEIENSRGLLNELEHERNELRKQMEELRYTIEKYQQREQDLNIMLNKERQNNISSQQIPERFVVKMNELTQLLQENVDENNHLSTVVVNLEEEKKRFITKINELEVYGQFKTPFTDPAARADHLFARYLKSESYRKALIFQKRYLITLLASYQNYSIDQLAEVRYSWDRLQTSNTSNTRTAINKFRVAAYAIIAVHRMQFIVHRWHSGKRERGTSTLTIHRSLGRLSSNPNNQAGDGFNEPNPWSGNSPPSKDQSRRKRKEAPLGNIIRESTALSPLQAPQLLSQYIDRFDNIDQRLGLVTNHPPT